MKIALINSPWDSKSFFQSVPWLPLGVVYLGTVLEQHGFPVQVLDAAAKGWSHEQVVGWLKRVSPDVVGLSALTLPFLHLMDLVKAIKAWNPRVVVVLGHYFATIEAERIVRKYGDYVDFCVRGEGESTFLALCQWLERHPGKDPGGVSGITFRDGARRVVSAPDAPLEADLDKIPFPNRSLVKHDYKWAIGGFELPHSRFTTMISSRGCPYNCTYCACTRFARQRWRARSAENIVAELAIVADQGYTDVNFVDDNFTLKKSRVMEVCERIKKEHIDINWHVDGRVDQASVDVYSAMHGAGCRLIWLGFESTSQRVLDIYNKKTRVDQIDRAIRVVRKAGIEIIVGLFMVGAPTETLDEMRHTLDFAVRSDIDLPVINLLDVYSGIQLWDDAIARGWMRDDDIVNVEVAGVARKAERWETLTKLIDVSRTPAEQAEIRRLVARSRRALFSLRRMNALLHGALRVVRSPWLRKIAADIAPRVPATVRTLATFRE
ncbi:MAG: radical SAM protein [Candidatus Lokiarchaeota archaeon]|nr:radical SAM protein [Candidatus Lokiarchaeota archaeon]